MSTKIDRWRGIVPLTPRLSRGLATLCAIVALPVQLWGQVPISPRVSLQDTSQRHQLLTKRGDRFIGRLLYVLPPETAFRLRSGDTLYFDVSTVQQVGVQITKPRPSFSAGGLFPDLFVSNTAYSLGAGQRQFRNTQMAWNHVDLAATDHYSIGLGYVLPFHVVVRTKIATSAEQKLNLAIGINSLFSLGTADDFPRTAHFYTALSLGEADRFFNLNAGYVLDFTRNRRSQFLFSGGGAFRLGHYWYLLVDNLYLLGRETPRIYPGFGLSYNRRRTRLDIGYFFFTTFAAELASSPGIGYAWKF
jgi:hypothetical protein